MPDWAGIRYKLRDAGIALADGLPRPVGGGDISPAWQAESDGGFLFLKTAARRNSGMFSAEAAGLRELQATDTLRIPAVLAEGVSGGDAFLALEWLDLKPMDLAAQRVLGERLALQHRCVADTHGWDRDNTIGATLQPNARHECWATFFVGQRLAFQFREAARNGFESDFGAQADRCLSAASGLLDKHCPQASLLHGDLWSGNCAAVNGEPVVFDPAVYYGDRETDLAMTRLFGGFAREFYAAYESAWPLPAGHENRVALYQLYHVLNHVNLFGVGYLGKAQSLLKDVIATADQLPSSPSATS